MTEPTVPDDDTKARLVKLLEAVEATPEAAAHSQIGADLARRPQGLEFIFLLGVGIGPGFLIFLLIYNWLF